MNNPEILISVIIPFKNEEVTLPIVLDSLAIQKTDFAWEVIFPDGCSTDHSVDVIKKHPLSVKVPTIVQPLPPENHGMTTARNAAVRIAKGKYLLFMQADVRIKDPEALNKTRRLLETPGVVGTSYVQLNADAEFSTYDFWGQVFQARYLGSRTPNAFDTKFNAVSREIFDKLNGFDEQRYAWGGEDFDFEVRLRPHGEIRDTGVEVEHLHGYGKPFSAMGTMKKYCRNSEIMGVTTPNYWRNRKLNPWFPRFLAMQLTLCAATISTLIPWTWPWSFMLLLAMGLWWNKAAFLHVHNWRRIYLPLYSLAAMYCFTYYFLRGLVFGRSLYKFDNKM